MASYSGRYVKDSGRPARQKGSRWLLLVYLWLAAALPEVLLHISTAQGSTTLFNSGLPLSLLFAIVPALVIYALTMAIPVGKVNFALSIVYSAVIYVLSASQLVYYKVFGTFYSAYSMANGGAAFQFVETILTTVWENLPMLLVMAVPLLFLCVFGWRIMRFDGVKPWIRGFVPVIAAVAIQIALVVALPLFGGTEALSPYDLYHENTDSYFSINKLGLSTAFRLDMTRFLTGYQPGGSLVLEDPPETTQTETKTPDPSGPVETTGGATEGTTAPTIDTSPNVLQIDFDQLIRDTSDEKIQQMHQYFSARTPSSKNEHTGLFEGSNLILITAEAFHYSLVDPEHTPTLYKLMTEGYNFTNYYVPDWGTSTTDGEYVFLTGTVPKSGVWSFSRTAKEGQEHLMPLTMAQQLIGRGYSAYAYHGHTYTYYDRNLYLENLGYTYRAYGQNLDVKKSWPESDLEVVDKTTADYVNNEPFTAYYMTISGHREFTFTGNYISSKNQDYVADAPYSTNVKAYLACQLELEFSMELLLERLEEAGVLDNTVIVLTADHYPNGLTMEELAELTGEEIEKNFQLFQNGCIIWKPGMTPETIDEPCSHMDLLPTLSNLFGLEFDSRLYMGRDVFSDAAPLVMFRNRSWITDQASYNSNTGEVINFTDTPVTDDYVKGISKELNNRFTISSRILDYDYWRILFGD